MEDASITQSLENELGIADKLDAGKHWILLLVEDDIGVNLAFRIRPRLSALVGDVAVENHCIACRRAPGPWFSL